MRSTGDNSVLSPELKSWLDNAVVPALVKGYMAEMRAEKQPCPQSEPVADCAATEQATAEGVR